jgi:hypothetical protein
MFSINENKFIELSMINNDRHYHSSCSFDSAAIYIFGGISNSKYLNTIERLNVNLANIT